MDYRTLSVLSLSFAVDFIPSLYTLPGLLSAHVYSTFPSFTLLLVIYLLFPYYFYTHRISGSLCWA